MRIIELIFGQKSSSADVAKDRLKIMLAHERAGNTIPYLEDMKKEILEVIKKYTEVKSIDIKTERNQNIELLEVEVVLNRDGKQKGVI